ncbi:MAG: hypothetical protein CMO44_13205 [Verrucomicrobiales bacterium]|nr:hypothetical protein [Verrucomicrobiales bacterium]
MPKLPKNYGAKNYDPLISALEEDDWFAPIAQQEKLAGGRSRRLKKMNLSPEKLAESDADGNPYNTAIAQVKKRALARAKTLERLEANKEKAVKMAASKDTSDNRTIALLDVQAKKWQKAENLKNEIAQKRRDHEEKRMADEAEFQKQLRTLDKINSSVSGGGGPTDEEIINQMLKNDSFAGDIEMDEFEGGKRRRKRGSKRSKSARKSKGKRRTKRRSKSPSKSKSRRKTRSRSRSSSGSKSGYGRRRNYKTKAGNNFYVSRRADGRITGVVSRGKSQRADMRVKAKNKVKSGYGSMGDL